MTEPGRSMRDTIILGIPFSRLTNDQTLDLFDRMIKQRSRNIIITVNLDCAVRAMKDPILKRIMYGAPVVTPDGMPLVWAGRTMKPALTERVAGSDFIPMLLERAGRKNHSVYFLGGREDVALRAAEQCKVKYPGLRIAGVYSPPFGTVWEMDNADTIVRINEAAPDILIVAFGNPKQEYWMAMNSFKLNVPVTIGVGATIDFLSGIVPRAPQWMKSLSAEWMFRLSLEPRRLAMRYAIDLRDGLIPLIFQTATNGLMRLVHAFSRRGDHETLKVAKVTVGTEHDEVHVMMLEECTKHRISHFASGLKHYVGNECDGVILDLRSSGGIDSQMLSNIVAIDQQLRTQAKHCILITGTSANIILRIAKMYDLLTTVPNKETALEALRAMGKRSLAVMERQRDNHVRILSLSGELTNDSAFLLDETRPTLWGDSPVIFDLTGIRFLDTGGLQYLLDQWNEVRGIEEKLHCVITNKFFSSTLNQPGLRQHFALYSTIDEALSNLDGAVRQPLMHQQTFGVEK